MNPRQATKLSLGGLIWAALIVAAIIGLRRVQHRAPAVGSQLVSHLVSTPRSVKLRFPNSQVVAINDPVYLEGGETTVQIGKVSWLGPEDKSPGKDGEFQKIEFVTEVIVTLFGNAPTLRPNSRFALHATPQSTDWVIKTMLPDHKREEIVRLMMDAYRLHMTEIAAAFKPVVKASLQQAGSVIREDLQVAFEKRDAQIRSIGARFEDDLIQQEFIPLIQDEVWPILQERGEPLASTIGTELWRELSLWRFGWRYLYDRSPLPERNFTETEFERFVNEKAMPVLKSHVPDMLELQQELVKEFSENEKIRTTFRESFRTVINDDEVQNLLTSVFQEVFLKNDRLQQVMQDYWTSDQARTAIDLATKRLDPTINRIGEAMFGNPNKSITPEFARVVRRMVLRKDQRWLSLEPGESDDSFDETDLPAFFPVEIPVSEQAIPYSPARIRD